MWNTNQSNYYKYHYNYNYHYKKYLKIGLREAGGGFNIFKLKLRLLLSKQFNAASDFLSSTLTGHGHVVRSVAFDNQGMLASGSFDNTIKIWKANTGELVQTLTGHVGHVGSVSFDNQGLLASGSWDRTIKIWRRVLFCYTLL